MSKTILNEQEMDRALTRLSYEIIERNMGVENVALVGIETRGIYLAKRIATKISEIDSDISVLAINIDDYRDDNHEVVRQNHESVLTDKRVVLVDDVLFTGRTVRAAMDGVIDLGRPKDISLAVLIDRGHRELPIRPDYIGKNVPTSKKERVYVRVKEIDGLDEVTIES
ncbi:MAG: bifunctional pyr operon transcriptional regulator/uracil phosphoribosyltransferase PyrR [Erysipelothrix sp.]